MNSKYNKGFTLIELIITVAILSIIAAVAIPSYDRYKRKGYRMDAISYLTRAAAFEESWLAENSLYTADKLKLGGNLTTKDHYTITVTTASSGPSFTITAIPKGVQTSDTQCAQFSIDNLGRRLAIDSSNNDTSKTCWGR